MTRCVVENVSKRFRTEIPKRARKESKAEFLSVLEGVTFTVEPGEFLSIVGPSGCGKSTILRIIAGLEKPSSGQVRIDDQTVTGPARTKGFIFQAVGLYPWRNAIQNIEFYLEINGVMKQERRRIAEEKLALVGLSEFANFPPVQLSGGMQQKVAIARALTTEPSILLMDEPFGALDALSRERSQADLLQILSKDKERSIIFVTHGIDEAVYLSDKVVVFSPRPGKIKDVINIDLGKERWARDIRSTSKFTEHCSEIRQTLLKEMQS